MQRVIPEGHFHAMTKTNKCGSWQELSAGALGVDSLKSLEFTLTLPIICLGYAKLYKMS